MPNLPWLRPVLLSTALLLPGCPIYSDEVVYLGCYGDYDCPGGTCDYSTGNCVDYVALDRCDEPSDCGANETCSVSGVCKVGDCTFHGCVSGYACTIASDTRWSCEPLASGTGGVSVGGGSPTEPEGGSDGGAGGADAGGAGGHSGGVAAGGAASGGAAASGGGGAGGGGVATGGAVGTGSSGGAG